MEKQKKKAKLISASWVSFPQLYTWPLITVYTKLEKKGKQKSQGKATSRSSANS